MAERVGFEPTYSLLDRNSISSRARYDLFGTSPQKRESLADIASQRQGVFEKNTLPFAVNYFFMTAWRRRYQSD